MTNDQHLETVPVSSSRDMREFIRLPHAIYADDPHWVPPLDLERKEHLSRKNPLGGRWGASPPR